MSLHLRTGSNLKVQIMYREKKHYQQHYFLKKFVNGAKNLVNKEIPKFEGIAIFQGPLIVYMKQMYLHQYI